MRAESRPYLFYKSVIYDILHFLNIYVNLLLIEIYYCKYIFSPGQTAILGDQKN
jgi:hypothetical protein